MPAEPRGGLFQDEAWVSRELVGCPLERFLGLLDEPGGEPLVFFLEPGGVHWQRFYLDAGLGFWGEVGDREVAEELEGEAVIDWGERFGIAGEAIGVVKCEPGPRLRIEVGSGEIVLETTDPADLDAPCKTPRFRPAGRQTAALLPA